MKTKLLLSALLLFPILLTHGQWTWTYDSLSQPRNWMGAASFGTKAYFAGGETDLGNTSILEIYDVETGTWDIPGNFSVGRSTMSAVACDSLVFFAGGFDNALTASSDVDIWDTRTHQWSIIEQLSIPRFALSAVSKDHKVLFAGGLIYDFTCYDRVDIYDTQTGTWDPTATLSLARGAMAAAVVGDLAIFAGGTRPDATVTDRVDIYNFTTKTWSTATLSQARCQAEATTVGNKVIIAGGMTDYFDLPSDVVDIYDAVTNTWTYTTLSVARMSAGAATIDGKAYFAGGGQFTYGAVLSDFSNVIDIYDPVSNTWTVDYLSQPVASHSVVAVGNHLLVAGGKTEGSLRVKTVEILDVVDGMNDNKITDYELRITNYPNPVSQSTTFSYTLKEPGHVTIQIFNSFGQLIAEPLNAYQTKGEQKMTWNASDLPEGLYFYRIHEGNDVGGGKLIKW